METALTLTLMAFTRLAVLLATSLALCTKCRLATGLEVLLEARRQALHRADVCLATTVAADNTYKREKTLIYIYTIKINLDGATINLIDALVSFL